MSRILYYKQIVLNIFARNLWVNLEIIIFRINTLGLAKKTEHMHVKTTVNKLSKNPSRIFFFNYVKQIRGISLWRDAAILVVFFA